MNSEIKIFTDGSSRGNPGPGGWGAVVWYGDDVRELGGREEKTTNNRMELEAILQSVLFAKKMNLPTTIYSDSSYAIQGATAWINNWKRNNWQTKQKTEVLNRDIWEKLSEALENTNIKWIQLEGHVGVLGNERADEIATLMADDKAVELFDGSYDSYDKDLDDLTSVSSIKEKKDRSKMKAYSYLSLVDGELMKHQTWTECEARVKGKKDVKFKKSVSAEDEIEIIREWGVE